mmetsp:Transcript_21454/g.19030  ORF Transcript_21454/g.19030 Transcript_21454/m.19030 type:complete len:540 (+) Transcript_21454:606-2225(+)
MTKKTCRLSNQSGEEAGGSFVSGSSSRMSFTDRAMSFLKPSSDKGSFKAAEPLNNKNILMVSQKNEYIYNAFSMDENQLAEHPSLHLITLYSIPYIIFLNNKIGRIELYQFDIANREFVKNKQYIDLIPECTHAIHSVDQLLIVHNLDAQFSKIFDMSVKPIIDPVCKNLPLDNRFSVDSYVSDGIQAEFEVDYLDDNEENLESFITGRKNFVYIEQSMFECKLNYNQPTGAAQGNVDEDDEDQVVIVDINILFDDPSLYDKEEESKGSRDSNIFQKFSINNNNFTSNIYSDDVIYAPDNVIFNLHHGACLGYMLSLKNYSSIAKSTIRIFKSLLLRKKSKTQAIRFIKYLILRKTSLEILTKIFLKINGVYKDATNERTPKPEGSNNDALNYLKNSTASVGGQANQVLRSMSLAVANSGRKTLPAQYGSTKLSNSISEHCNDTSKIMSGEVIIFQHEMVQIFVDIIDVDSVIYNYLRSVIVEYIRCLQEFNLTTHPRLQSILWKFIWKNRDFIGLQNLLQYKVIDDTLELAQYLVQLG